MSSYQDNKHNVIWFWLLQMNMSNTKRTTTYTTQLSSAIFNGVIWDPFH